MRVFLTVAVAAYFCVPAAADEIDLSFNSDALRLQYAHPFNSNALQIDGGWLYHDDNGDVLHVGLNLTGLATQGSDPVKAGVGARVTYSDGERSKQSGFAVGIGGFFRYALARYNRISISGQVYFAPSVMSLGDVDKFHDYTIRVGYNIMKAADVYIGARYVKGEYDGADDVRYDTGMNIGFNLRF